MLETVTSPSLSWTGLWTHHFSWQECHILLVPWVPRMWLLKFFPSLAGGLCSFCFWFSGFPDGRDTGLEARHLRSPQAVITLSHWVPPHSDVLLKLVELDLLGAHLCEGEKHLNVVMWLTYDFPLFVVISGFWKIDYYSLLSNLKDVSMFNILLLTSINSSFLFVQKEGSIRKKMPPDCPTCLFPTGSNRQHLKRRLGTRSVWGSKWLIP